MKVMQLFLPPSLSNFWQDNTSIQLSSLIMFHACVPALIVVLSHFTPVWSDFVINNDRPKKAHPRWRSSCHQDASDGVKRPIFHILSSQRIPHCSYTDSREQCKSCGLQMTLTDTHNTTTDIPSQPNEGSHHNSESLKGNRNKETVQWHMEAQQGRCYC